MICDITRADPFRCPTKWELFGQILALLPRGRAWQSHEDVIQRVVAAESAQSGAYESGSTGLGTEPVSEPLTGLQSYWAALAEVLAYLHLRACALIEEMWCATATETRAEWGTEYGFPDDCEPWDTLCDKVVALGGSTCGYLASLAARVGYVIECIDCEPGAAEAGCAEAGLQSPCVCVPNVMTIRIIASLSPAYISAVPFEAGSAEAGCTTPCAPVPDIVVCLVERWKPAHVVAHFEII